MRIRQPDSITLFGENGTREATIGEEVSFRNIDTEAGTASLYVTAEDEPLSGVRLRFDFTPEDKRYDGVHVLGDAYERAYSDLHWSSIEPERVMPWYILVSNGSDLDENVENRFTEGFGVLVQPSAFVTWQYDGGGVTLNADIRSGGCGVILGGRELKICDIVFGEFRCMSAFEAGREFCRMMCRKQLEDGMRHLPKKPVYGSNNWYYAYGSSSHDDILTDSAILADESRGAENKAYMVIDDGWEKYSCDGPWDILRPSFRNMKELADEMREKGVRPGIWVRLLADEHHELNLPDECYLGRDKRYLDPSNEEVIRYVRGVVRMLRDWGYELIKHDFSTVDVFGNYGFSMKDGVTADGWAFSDRSRTSAEIMVDFYRCVSEEAGDDCVIIGCNTFSHLCAGIYGLNRTGDDTSGFDWSRTLKMGVNSLAFRLIQNGSFYMADADCVGITGAIDWKLNRQWLTLLAHSGSPLFISQKPDVLGSDEVKDVSDALLLSSVQKNDCRPLDWMETELPELWLIDGEKVRFDWYGTQK